MLSLFVSWIGLPVTVMTLLITRHSFARMVKVISANENISEGSKGIILEYILESTAEYYSADLLEKVIRGLT